MMKIWQKDSILMRVLRNKYLMALFIFLVWLLLFDQNNLIDRARYMHTLNQLEKERDYYLERIREDSLRLTELKTNKANLEKFAREQYLMKRENEDVFVIVREE